MGERATMKSSQIAIGKLPFCLVVCFKIASIFKYTLQKIYWHGPIVIITWANQQCMFWMKKKRKNIWTQHNSIAIIIPRSDNALAIAPIALSHMSWSKVWCEGFLSVILSRFSRLQYCWIIFFFFVFLFASSVKHVHMDHTKPMHRSPMQRDFNWICTVQIHLHHSNCITYNTWWAETNISDCIRFNHIQSSAFYLVIISHIVICCTAWDFCESLEFSGCLS